MKCSIKFYKIPRLGKIQVENRFQEYVYSSPLFLKHTCIYIIIKILKLLK